MDISIPLPSTMTVRFFNEESGDLILEVDYSILDLVWYEAYVEAVGDKTLEQYPLGERNKRVRQLMQLLIEKLQPFAVNGHQITFSEARAISTAINSLSTELKKKFDGLSTHYSALVADQLQSLYLGSSE